MLNRSVHSLPMRLAVLTGLLGALGASLLLFLSAPSASANPYCGGKHLGNHETCNGTERRMLGDRGYGEQHSVCVGVGGVTGKCSGGAHQIAEFVYIEELIDFPWIQNNAAGENVVFAESF